MKFSVITLFPDLIQEMAKMGVVGQAITNQLIQLDVYTPRSWTQDTHKTVDDRPFGGGDGMVLMSDPLSHCIESITTTSRNASSGPLNEALISRYIYLSPQGFPLNHSKVKELANEKHLLLLCGRYAGVDQRVLNHFEFEEISIGDYVLSGGELAALVIIDAVGRQLPGVLGHESSSVEDSFAADGLLEAPCYTRPREWKGQFVPEFLLTGNHAQIEEDRWFLSQIVTFVKRPDLFDLYLRAQNQRAQTRSPKILKKLMERFKLLPPSTLTSLGLTRKNLEDFEMKLNLQGSMQFNR